MFAAIICDHENDMQGPMAFKINYVMPAMKTKAIKNILALALILFTVFGCGKYDDGPSFSLRSKGGRMNGHYTVSEFIKNGVDITSKYLDSCGCEFEFSYSGCVSCNDDDPSNPCEGADGFLTFICPNNDYNYCLSADTLIAPVDTYYFQLNCWSFSNDKKEIVTNMGEVDTTATRIGMFPFNMAKSDRFIKILRLTNSELWLEISIQGVISQLKLDKQ